MSLSARHHCPRSRQATDFFAYGMPSFLSSEDLFLCKIDLKNLREISINGQKNKADVAGGSGAKARRQKKHNDHFYRRRLRFA